MSEDIKQIPKQQDRLEKAIDNLNGMIGELDNILSSIMTAPTPVPGDDPKAENLVDYALFLCKMADSVDFATDRIRSIRARLQI